MATKTKQQEKQKEEKGWTYEEKSPRDDLKLQLAGDWQVKVFKVTSGDSGKEYYVHLLYQLSYSPKNKTPIALCTCPQGEYLHTPLVATGQYGSMCKHSIMLVEFLASQED
jgi:hypothetical protein